MAKLGEASSWTGRPGQYIRNLSPPQVETSPLGPGQRIPWSKIARELGTSRRDDWCNRRYKHLRSDEMKAYLAKAGTSAAAWHLPAWALASACF